MKPITVVLPYFPHAGFEAMLKKFSASDCVEKIILNGNNRVADSIEKVQHSELGPVTSGKSLTQLLNILDTDFLLVATAPRVIDFEPLALKKLLDSAVLSGAGITYCNYFDLIGETRVPHTLNDYQRGSVRDDFDFGPLILFSMKSIRDAVLRHGTILDVRSSALYDLRLKISIDYSVKHIDQCLYAAAGQAGTAEGQFAYVDPRHEAQQKEMENVFTAYLKETGAYIHNEDLSGPPQGNGRFPVEASVIIPVKNRKGTIADAVESAFSQKADFSFNVIVVDNYSTDGTTAVLSELSRKYAGLKHIIPGRKDLGIGGCWNEAVTSDYCGRYAVQLDSDDLYAGPLTLQKIVDMFKTDDYAMIIGSYTIVDFDLDEISPGLIDHREWTTENGHNNALRVNGMGAPRAYRTELVRAMPFLNVSYGEDYAAVLRICREYRIGRIFESLYLCRRWPGNTDAELSLQARNANDSFKDRIRTEEILARRELNRNRSSV